MPPVSWPTASIFWTWRSLRLGRLALGHFALKVGIGGAQLDRAGLHRLVELGGAIFGAGRFAPGAHRVEEGAPGEDREADRADADQDRQPAEPVRIGVDPGGDALRALRAAGEADALGARDVLQQGAQGGEGGRGRRLIEQPDAVLAAPRLGGGGGGRQFLAALAEQGLEAGDAHALLGVGAEHLAELADLIGAVAPLIVIIHAGLLALVEDVAAERGLGACDRGIDRAGHARSLHRCAAPSPAPRRGLGSRR